MKKYNIWIDSYSRKGNTLPTFGHEQSKENLFFTPYIGKVFQTPKNKKKQSENNKYYKGKIIKYW